MMVRFISQVAIVLTKWARNLESISTTPSQAPFKFQTHFLGGIGMESHCKIAVQKFMAQALEQLSNQPAWWYSLNGGKDYESSLACLIYVGYEDLSRILLSVATARRKRVKIQDSFRIRRFQDYELP